MESLLRRLQSIIDGEGNHTKYQPEECALSVHTMGPFLGKKSRYKGRLYPKYTWGVILSGLHCMSGLLWGITSRGPFLMVLSGKATKVESWQLWSPSSDWSRVPSGWIGPLAACLTPQPLTLQNFGLRRRLNSVLRGGFHSQELYSISCQKLSWTNCWILTAYQSGAMWYYVVKRVGEERNAVFSCNTVQESVHKFCIVHSMHSS